MSGVETDSWLDDCLKELLPPEPEYNEGLLPDEEGYSYETQTVLHRRREATAHAKAQILAKMEQAIGEDDKYDRSAFAHRKSGEHVNKPTEFECGVRNKLRAEIRQRLAPPEATKQEDR